MTVKFSAGSDGKEAVLSIAGRFDFGVHEEFRAALEKIRAGEFTKFTIDLGAVEDMDSAALGMLLLLRDNLGGEKANVQIVRSRPEIREMLNMANFSKLFRIT